MPGPAVLVVARLQQAVNVLCQTTVETFVALYTETITDQAQRLEEFTRLAAHEWRQPLSTLQFGVTLLQRPDLDGARTARLWDAMERNVAPARGGDAQARSRVAPRRWPGHAGHCRRCR